MGLVDFEFGASRDGLGRALGRTGCDLLRVRWATYADTLDDVLAAGLRTGDPLLPGDADRLTHGAAEDHQRRLAQHPHRLVLRAVRRRGRLEYPAGQPNLDGAELRDLLARAHAGGLEVATHAIGDAAVAEALDAYAETGARGSIEHAQLVGRADIAGGWPSSASGPACSPPTCSTTATSPSASGPGAASGASPSAGCSRTASSWPSAPTRRSPRWTRGWRSPPRVHRSDDERDAWHAEQALTAQEALAASVDGRPTVAVGSLADLAVARPRPARRPPPTPPTARAALRDRTVALTAVAGAVVHDAAAEPRRPGPDSRAGRQFAGAGSGGRATAAGRGRRRPAARRRRGGRPARPAGSVCAPLTHGSAEQMSWPSLARVDVDVVDAGGRRPRPSTACVQALVERADVGVVARRRAAAGRRCPRRGPAAGSRRRRSGASGARSSMPGDQPPSRAWSSGRIVGEVLGRAPPVAASVQGWPLGSSRRRRRRSRAAGW